MLLRNQEFLNGVLIRDDVVEVADPAPVPPPLEEQVRVLTAQVVSLKAALAESSDPAIQSVVIRTGVLEATALIE